MSNAIPWTLCALLASPFASAQVDRMEGLIKADRAASTTLWTGGLSEMLREAFGPDALLLIPGSQVVTAEQAIIGLDGHGSPTSPERMAWDPVGLELSRDSSLGVTWGVVAKEQDSARPATGRYVAVWRHEPGGWKVAACALLGITPSAGAPWSRLPRSIPSPRPSADAERFFAADREFANVAATRGSAHAFRAWAAPDAKMFGRRGLLIMGSEMIANAVDGPDRWRWEPVAGGGSRDGHLGWTVGEATITPDRDAPFNTKYLSVWRTGADGSIRFILDAGNLRP